MTIISGVKFRPKNVGQKSSKKAVSQKLEEKKRDSSIHDVLKTRHDEE